MTAAAQKKAAPKPAKPPHDKRLTELESKVETLTWLHAELAAQHKALLDELRRMIAQQILQSPEMQQRMQDELVKRMSSGNGLP